MPSERLRILGRGEREQVFEMFEIVVPKEAEVGAKGKKRDSFIGEHLKKVDRSTRLTF
jgi:hypothetical protein